MVSNKLRALGTRSSTPSCSLSVCHILCCSSLFVYSRSNELIYFLVYVDDLIITGSDPSLVDTIIWKLDSKFFTKDLRDAIFLLWS